MDALIECINEDEVINLVEDGILPEREVVDLDEYPNDLARFEDLDDVNIHSDIVDIDAECFNPDNVDYYKEIY